MPKSLKWFGLISTMAVVFVAIAFALGARLPEESTVARRLRSHASPDAIWQALTDYPGQKDWRPNVESVTKLADVDGKEAWQEKYRSGETVMYVTEVAEAPRRLVRRMAGDQRDVQGTWEFLIEPGTERTSVVLIERARIASPMARFAFTYVLGQEKFVEGYLNALARKLGDPADVMLDKVDAPH